MRFARLLVLPVAVAGLIVFGATYDVPGPPEPRLSAGELAWLASFRDWAAEPLAERCGRTLAAAARPPIRRASCPSSSST